MTRARQILVLLVGLILAATAGAGHKTTILEYRDVQSFEAHERIKDGLEISGLVFHSSLGVKDVEKTSTGGEMNVSVHLGAASKSVQGNFRISLDIPASIEVVTFGQARTPIWRRGEGIVAPK